VFFAVVWFGCVDVEGFLEVLLFQWGDDDGVVVLYFFYPVEIEVVLGGCGL